MPSILGDASGAEAAEAVAVRAEQRRKLPEGIKLDVDAVKVEAVFALRSSHSDFGGLSGLWLSPDAGRLTAVSDKGGLWQARLGHDDTGRLVGIDGWTLADIPLRPDDPSGRRAFDAEALSDDGSSGLVIAYEGHHRLRRLPLADLGALPERLARPQGLGGPSNSGIEALATLDDGRLLAIAERVGARGGVGLSAWLIDGRAIQDLVYIPAPNFAPTGADRLDDTLYVVERHFSMLGGFRSRIVTVPVHEIEAGAHIEGRPLASFRWGDLGENFEAIVAKRAPDGRTLLYLLTDDNFSFFQETLLVQLSLLPRRAPGGVN